MWTKLRKAWMWFKCRVLSRWIWLPRTAAVVALIAAFSPRFSKWVADLIRLPKADSGGDPLVKLLGAVILVVMAFWEQISELIGDRSLVIGKEGVGLGSPGESTGARTSGTVRDNFIYLGYSFMKEQRWEEAAEFFMSADRLKSSVLTCFRTMQCLAQQGDNAQDLMLDYFDKAFRHTYGPWQDLKDRQYFIDLVQEWHTRRLEPNFKESLVKQLKDFQC